MNEIEFFQHILDNAKRLRDDSVLLNIHGRSHSSIILAVFALEELGKALINAWGVTNVASKREHSTHVEKQAAVFALLSSNEILKKNRRRLIKNLDREGPNFLKIGLYSHQFAWARSGFYDDVRKAATYADQNPKIPLELSSQFDHGLAEELHDYFRRAALATRNLKAMGLASEIYRNDLGRL